MRRDSFTAIKNSDHFDGAQYDSMNKIATVKFKNGYVYQIHGMHPQAYQDFMDSPSQGIHYHTYIKDHYRIERIK